MLRTSSVWLGALLAIGTPAVLPAQTLDTLPEIRAEDVPAGPHAIRWWHGAVALGGLSTLMLLDHPVQRFAQHNSGTGADNVAGFVRHFGQPEVYGTVTVGLLATGLATGRPQITRAGGRLAASLALAGTDRPGREVRVRPSSPRTESRCGRVRAVLRAGLVAVGTLRRRLRVRHLARRRHPPALGHRRVSTAWPPPLPGPGSTTTAIGSATWPPVPWSGSRRPSSRPADGGSSASRRRRSSRARRAPGLGWSGQF